MKVKKLYEHGYHQTDREGRPIWIDRACSADLEKCLKIMDDDMVVKYYVNSYEKLNHIILPACSKYAGRVIENVLNIVDCKGFKMALMSKKNREFLNLSAKISQEYYPETMWKMYWINTPFVFKVRLCKFQSWKLILGCIHDCETIFKRTNKKSNSSSREQIPQRTIWACRSW